MNIKRINFKTIGIAAAVIVLLALGAQTCRVIKAERALAGDRLAVKQAKADEALAKTGERVALDGWAKSIALGKQISDNADKQIAAAWKKEAAEHAAHLADEAKIKILTGDDLAIVIGRRINTPGQPPEIAALVAGGFTLTRPGGEKTYGVFLDGEQAARDLATEKTVSAEKDGKITAKALELKGCTDAVEAKDKTIEAKDQSIEKLNKNLHDLELARSLKFWKGLGYGTALGAAVVAALKIFGVWK